jgi:hypothetical protein
MYCLMTAYLTVQLERAKAQTGTEACNLRMLNMSGGGDWYVEVVKR